MVPMSDVERAVYYPADRRFRFWIRPSALAILFIIVLVPLTVAWIRASSGGCLTLRRMWPPFSEPPPDLMASRPGFAGHFLQSLLHLHAHPQRAVDPHGSSPTLFQRARIARVVFRRHLSPLSSLVAGRSTRLLILAKQLTEVHAQRTHLIEKLDSAFFIRLLRSRCRLRNWFPQSYTSLAFDRPERIQRWDRHRSSRCCPARTDARSTSCIGTRSGHPWKFSGSSASLWAVLGIHSHRIRIARINGPGSFFPLSSRPAWSPPCGPSQVEVVEGPGCR